MVWPGDSPSVVRAEWAVFREGMSRSTRWSDSRAHRAGGVGGGEGGEFLSLSWRAWGRSDKAVHSSSIGAASRPSIFTIRVKHWKAPKPHSSSSTTSLTRLGMTA